MKTLYIIRGLPGCGKSTLARKICHVVLETDSWFRVWDGDKGGYVYKYDPTKLAENHCKCQQACEANMNGEPLYVGSMLLENPPHSEIAVANTFTRQWEMEPYRELARKYGYQVVELTVKVDLTDQQLAARNVHGVPVDVIAKMRARWEP